MFHSLNIQERKNDTDYHVIANAYRPEYSRSTGISWYKNMRYVNTFLHKDVSEGCTGSFKASTSRKLQHCPDGPTKPPKDSPPPLRKGHQYHSNTLNEYFRLIKEVKENHGIPWDFSKAVYVHPMRGRKPERRLEYLAMRVLEHTYGGKSIRLKPAKQNLRGLIESVDENTQIIGLLGHGARAGDTVLGRVIVGRQRIREAPEYPYFYLRLKPNEYPLTVARRLQERIDELEKYLEEMRKSQKRSLEENFENKRMRYRERLEKKKKLNEAQIQERIEKKYGEAQFDKKLKQKLRKSRDYRRAERELKLRRQQCSKTERIQKKLVELGKKISPLAVIVLYHCHNGRRRDFIQKLADLVDKPVFAYTGLLGWSFHPFIGWRNRFTTPKINKNWTRLRKKLIRQEFAYLPKPGVGGGLSGQGDWVVATPSRFDEKITGVRIYEYPSVKVA